MKHCFLSKNCSVYVFSDDILKPAPGFSYYGEPDEVSFFHGEYVIIRREWENLKSS